MVFPRHHSTSSMTVLKLTHAEFLALVLDTLIFAESERISHFTSDICSVFLDSWFLPKTCWKFVNFTNLLKELVLPVVVFFLFSISVISAYFFLSFLFNLVLVCSSSPTFFFKTFILCVWTFASGVCASCVCNTHRCQKRALESLGLEQAIDMSMIIQRNTKE